MLFLPLALASSCHRALLSPPFLTLSISTCNLHKRGRISPSLISERERDCCEKYTFQVAVNINKIKQNKHRRTQRKTRREPSTDSTHIRHQVLDSNLGHIGGRRELSPLRHGHPCSQSLLQTPLFPFQKY